MTKKYSLWFLVAFLFLLNIFCSQTLYAKTPEITGLNEILNLGFDKMSSSLPDQIEKPKDELPPEYYEKMHDEEMANLKRQYNYSEGSAETFELSEKNPTAFINAPDGTELLIQQEILDEGQRRDRIRISIKKYDSDPNFADEKLVAIGSGFEITVFTDEGETIRNPINITLSNPELVDYLKRAQELLNREENDNSNLSPIMSIILDKAYAQQAGVPQLENKTPSNLNRGTKPEERKIGREVGVPGEVKPGLIDDPSKKAPKLWGRGMSPKDYRYPNNSPYEMMDEMYGTAFEGKSWPIRDLNKIPAQLDFANMGLTFQIPVPVIPFRGGLLDYLQARLFKPAKAASPSNVVKPSKDPEIDDPDCGYVWYDKWTRMRDRKITYVAGMEEYKTHPLYIVCGLRSLSSKTKTPAKFNNVVNTLDDLLRRSWKYYTGNDLSSMPFGPNDALNIKDYPKKAGVRKEFGVNLKNLTNAAGLMIAFAQLIELDVDSIMRDDEYDVCSIVTHELMHAFHYWSVSIKKGKAAVYKISNPLNEALATYMQEELCDKSSSDWSRLHGVLLEGYYNFNGTAHPNTHKDQHLDLNIIAENWIYPEHVYKSAGGYLLSLYLRTLDMRGKYLKEVLDGNIVNIFDFVTLGKNLNVQDANNLKALEYLRFVVNLMRCKVFGNIYNWTPNGYDFEDLSDKHKDIFGEIIQEYDGTIPNYSSKIYSFYNWFRCSDPNNFAETYGFRSYDWGDRLRSYYLESNKTSALSDLLLLSKGPIKIYPNENPVINKNPVIRSYYSENYKGVFPKDIYDKWLQDGFAVIRNEKSPIIAFRPGAILSRPHYFYDETSNSIKDMSKFISTINMIPYSTFYARIKFKDIRKTEELDDMVFSLYFYTFNYDGGALYQDYLSKLYVMLNSRIYRLDQLPVVELKDEKKVLPEAPKEGEITDISSIREFKIGLGNKNLTGNNIAFAIVNGNPDGLLENITTIKCSSSDDICRKFGTSCNKTTNTCTSNNKTLLPVRFRAEVHPYECPEGQRVTESGECGCAEKDAQFGKQCDAGFEAKSYKVGVKLDCSCVLKCATNEKWDINTKKCIKCESELDYNAFYDPSAPGKITECKRCPTNTKAKPTKECALSNRKGCKVECGCDKPFTLGKDEKSEPICIAPCELGDRWDGKKCIPCQYWETSTTDRMRCEPCSKATASGSGSTSRLDSCNNCEHNFIFFTSPLPRGCDRFFNRCVKKGVDYDNRWRYNIATRSCELCPKDKQFHFNDVSLCVDCPKNAAYTALGCRCPSGTLVNYNTWTCECPPGAILSTSACVCPTGGIWKAAKNYWGKACECPSGTKLSSDGKRCEKACSGGMVLVGGNCACPSGTTYSGGKCVTTQPSVNFYKAQCEAPVTYWTGPFIFSDGSGICCPSITRPANADPAKCPMTGYKTSKGDSLCCCSGALPDPNSQYCSRVEYITAPCSTWPGTRYSNGSMGWGCYK